MRRLVITFAAAASVTLAGAGSGLFLAAPAQASGPVGSCPAPFTLVAASIAPSADLNGDGLICEKLLTPTDQPFGPGFGVVIDNTVQS